MQWLARFWNRLLTASAGSGCTPDPFAQAEVILPDAMRSHGEREHGHGAAHTWKSHGGFRH